MAQRPGMPGGLMPTPHTKPGCTCGWEWPVDIRTKPRMLDLRIYFSCPRCGKRWRVRWR